MQINKNFLFFGILVTSSLFLQACSLKSSDITDNQSTTSIAPTLSPTSVPVKIENSFFQTGNLTKNNPGFKPNTWYLVYDEPGSPAKNQELYVNGKTACSYENTSKTCILSEIKIGERAEIKGTLKNNIVEVSSIFIFNNGSVIPTVITNKTIQIDWDMATSYIKDCSVRSYTQAADLNVVLVLKDGRRLQVKESKLGDIATEYNAVRKNCTENKISLSPTKSKDVFECPMGKWVDCMPGINTGYRPQCSKEYLNWAKANCPGFEGAAM